MSRVVAAACVDTSVAVPALLADHEAHAVCRKALTRATSIPAHAFAESYSVLTRLPPNHRLPSDVAATLLHDAFRDRVLTLDARTQRGLVSELAGLEIAGGAVFDALVGLAARAHDCELLTRDARAAGTYEKLGVAFRMIA